MVNLKIFKFNEVWFIFSLLGKYKCMYKKILGEISICRKKNYFFCLCLCLCLFYLLSVAFIL